MTEPRPVSIAARDLAHAGRIAAALVRNRLMARPSLSLVLPVDPRSVALFADIETWARAGQLPSSKAHLILIGGSAKHSLPPLDGIRFASVSQLDEDDSGASIRANVAVAYLPARGDMAVTELAAMIRVLQQARELVIVMQEPLGSIEAELLEHPQLSVVSVRAETATTSDLRRVIVVPGHAEHHVITPTALARIRLAETVVAEQQPVAVILCGWGGAQGSLSEAAQMAVQMRLPGVALLLDEASSVTAENASCSFDFARALEATHLVVATSNWHRMRAELFFRWAARGSRIRVSVCTTSSPPPTAAQVLSEIRYLTHIPRDLRQVRDLYANGASTSPHPE